ncbi:site-specific DNA-methyltransferase [Campylobacter sp. LR286c]|uniref:site-specific DNA-methyltransferase n=1 Tax=Campylobacter sp. LR286c TaxID=2593545 RepID=UPI001237AB68|nr:site-specific DNA-methyltransferase [Campylobacter sp. LR286c]KAA6226299.1 site-specific DNA-methyltransferase [Campylobacter sp. LR286c]
MGTKLSELQKEKIREIDDIASVSFNQEQKAIAKKIIENTPDSDLHEVFNFITQRVKLGFVFDEAPEVNHNAVSFVRENENLNINITNLENLAGNIEHKLIIGENYDALKNLLVTHYEKIDVIYIDPPYNTEAMKGDGNDYKDEISANKFIYRDKFTRNGWLNMMNERLKLARKLLKDSGVIFISIDDSEQAYLKVLCDEIFGEGNFVCDFIRKTKSTTNDAKTGVNIQHENCLCYAKDKSKINLLGGEKDLSKYSNPDNDPNGAWVSDNPSAKSGTMENGYFGVTNPYTCKVDYPPQGRFWLFSQNTMQKHINEGRICFKKEYKENERGFIYKRYLKDLKTTKKTFDSLKFISNEFMNQAATKELLSLEMAELFTYPKPIEFIKGVLSHATNKDSIVLDFFAGSGTTAQAVMELNTEDGGRRECILVTNNENNIAINVTRERLYRVINGEGSKGEPIKWQYSKDKKCLEGNSVRVFEIETHELSLKDLEKAQDLTNIAKGELQKLNPEYDINDELKIYSELASLNPQKDK